MPRKIIIEINPENYLVWREFFEIDLMAIDFMAKMNAKKCENKKEVLEEVEKLLLELRKYEENDPPYYHDFDD